MANVVLADS